MEPACLPVLSGGMRYIGREPSCWVPWYCRAERGSSGSFWSGFIVGGTIMGALGFIFAPQVGCCCCMLARP